MSDIESSTNAVGSSDPVAEFLAREQSVLGDLEDDLIVSNKDDDAVINDSNNEIRLNGEMNDFEGANGDINSLSNGISDISINNKQREPSLVTQPIIPAEEPESIKRWREEHLKALEKKDADEKKKIEELREQAKKELEEWYHRYKEQVENAKKQNRAAEKEWIAERDNEQPGQAWEKISRMCDFNPKTSRNNRDTSRMRSMLLQLKQNPPSATASASASST